MAAQTQTNGRKRMVHQLDTPYSTVQWPEIAQEDQDSLLELLCSFLSPIGQHRNTHVKPSKGKKAAKAERKSKADAGTAMAIDTSPPPPPELVHHVDIGLNAITKSLESKSEADGDTTGKGNVLDPSSTKQYAVVFVARGDQSSVFNCHFPKMIGAASKDLPEEEQIRLVRFSKSCSDRLSKSLAIPRVSSIGILKDAPGAKGLLDMVAGVVKPVKVPWLDNSRQPAYLATKINTTETTIGQKRQKVN